MFGGDITGPFDLNVTQGTVSLSVRDPSPNAPISEEPIFDKKGYVVGVSRRAVVAGDNNSNATSALFDGIGRGIIRPASNLIGTALSGVMGILAVTGATANTAAQINSDKVQGVATTRAGVAVTKSNNATALGLAR